MKRSSYREQDYAFGQIMLNLRTVIGLTQAALADILGVSRRSVADWEAGNKYPHAEHLRQFITFAVEQQAFHAGHEAEEIRALWHAAHQKVLLDEVWLADLLPPTQTLLAASTMVTSLAPNSSYPAHRGRVDWDDALAVRSFYGREWELAELTRWIVEENCQLVGVLGLGGIGKSVLSITLMHQVAEHFDVVIWHSLRDAPTCEVLLDECLQILASLPTGKSLDTLDQRLRLFLEYLRSQRALVVLDNLETLLEEGEDTSLRPGYEAYERLLHEVAQTRHRSCLLFTSREKPSCLAPMEGRLSSVRTLRLIRLETRPCEQLLAEKGIEGTAAERVQLIDAYAGNPLALKIVAQTIVDLFGGAIAPFLKHGEIIFGSIRTLLEEQFVRLSTLEQNVLLWLAILREPSTLDELLAMLVTPVPYASLLEAVDTLNRRSLVERGQRQASFTLQSVVLEYATAQFIVEAANEILTGELARLIEHGFELTQSREYIQQTQVRLVVAPILAHLYGMYRQKAEVEAQLFGLLEALRTRADDAQGYASANLVVLLGLLRGDLRDLNLSGLILRSVNFQGITMQDTSLAHATIQDCLFTETFDAMTALAISHSGEYWAAASRRGEIRLWEASGHSLRYAWRGHVDMVWALAFSADEQMLATGSWDGLIKVWDISNGALLWSGKHTSSVTRVAISPDGKLLASAGNDATVRLWDLRSGTLLQTVPHPSAVDVVIWSPDGNVFASGDMEGRIWLWAVGANEPAQELHMLLGHSKPVPGLAFAPDGHTLASGGWDGTVKVWDVASGKLLQTMTGHTDRVGHVAWSPDGKTLASGGSDRTILLWDVERGSYRALLKGHTEGVYELAFSPDSSHLLSGSRDGTLRLWDTTNGQCIRVISGYAAAIYEVDWSPDGTQLVSGGTDRLITTWNVSSGTPLLVLPGHYGVICTVGWNSQGRWLASSESEHAIRLWDLKTAGDSRMLQALDDSGQYMYRLAWSPDGKSLASGTNQGGVSIWNVDDNLQHRVARQNTPRILRVSWSPDGRYLAGGGDDGIVYIWNVAEDILVDALVGHRSLIKSLAWSPDGTRLASGANGEARGEMFIWDVLGGGLHNTLEGHTGVVSAMAWDSMGNVLISGSGDGTLQWWHVAVAECLWVREAHQGTVQSLKRSPDGTTLASCGDDGAIKLWDIDTGEHLQTMRRDRPYERLNIRGIRGLTEAQKAILYDLGAVDADPDQHSLASRT